MCYCLGSSNRKEFQIKSIKCSLQEDAWEKIELLDQKLETAAETPNQLYESTQSPSQTYPNTVRDLLPKKQCRRQ